MMHSSVYRSHCLPAGHHPAAEQCTLECPTRFPWHICRNTVVWHGSSFVSSCKDLYAHCSCNRAVTQLMQDAQKPQQTPDVNMPRVALFEPFDRPRPSGRCGRMTPLPSSPTASPEPSSGLAWGSTKSFVQSWTLRPELTRK